MDPNVRNCDVHTIQSGALARKRNRIQAVVRSWCIQRIFNSQIIGRDLSQPLFVVCGASADEVDNEVTIGGDRRGRSCIAFGMRGQREGGCESEKPKGSEVHVSLS